ncbi:hypothetical protein CsSME_00027840 [Camellia sinensis var. sinensis]
MQGFRNANPTRIKPFREVCDANVFKIATSLIMMGIELPGQLAGVEGTAPLGRSGAAPRRGRGAAPPKQNAKMHSKLPVRSSGHYPARAENPWFQQFVRSVKILECVISRSSGFSSARADLSGCWALERTARTQESCSSVDSEEFEPEALVDSEVAHRKDNSEMKTGWKRHIEVGSIRRTFIHYSSFTKN